MPDKGLKTRLSRRQEDDIADVLPSAQRTPASGSRRESHDVQGIITDTNEWWRFRYEAKCTQNKSYSFKLDEWKQLVSDVYSRDAQERPAWAIRFYGDGLSNAPVLQDLVAIDLNDWCELLEELERLRGLIQVIKKTSK